MTQTTRALIRQRWTMCSRKKSYDSKHNAEQSKVAREKQLSAYCCPVCKGWHLTKKNEEPKYMKQIVRAII